MRILFLEAFSQRNFSTRWRTYCVSRYLKNRQHDCHIYHWQIDPRDIALVRALPVVLQNVVVRLLATVRARRSAALARKTDCCVVLNAYSSGTLISFLQRQCGGYIYDTVDFADCEDFIRLHCAPGWRGALARWRMRHNYRVFLKYLDGARLVVTNNFHCINLAKQRGKDAFLFIDPIPADYLQPVVPAQKLSPFTIGWTGSPATAHYMAEYVDVLRSFVARGQCAIELMEGSTAMATATGAVCVPWIEPAFRARVPRWHVGIAPLPSRVEFPGKFPGKILQYMAAGIPSIVTPKGMATHFIKDGETGLYAETPEDWQRCIQFLLEHPDEVARMGANARRDFETRFSLEAQMPEYERVVLGIKPPAAAQ